MRSKIQRPENHSNVNPWQRWALNIGATLGTICILIALATFVFGLKPLIFASGSMGPGIPTGSLGLAVPTPVAEVIPGQVVSVVTSDGTRVTHRVVENIPVGLVMKGDANSTADLQPYQVATADRLLVSVPVLGYVASWFSQPWAFVIGGMLCAYLLYVAFFRRESDRGPGDATRGTSYQPRSDSAEPSTRRRTLTKIGAIVTALAVVVPLGAVNNVERTQAAWTSTSTAVAPIEAATMPAPTGLSCQNAASGRRSVTVSWSEPVNAPVAVEQYKVTVTAGGTSSSATVPAGTTSQVLSLDDSKGLLGGLLGLLGGLLEFLLSGPKSVAINVVAVYPGDWISAAVSKSNMATITPVLLSARIECT